MNALAKPIPMVPASAFDAWVDDGRNLAERHRNLGFEIGDWLNRGRERFPEQLDLALEQAGIDQRYALKASTVAKLFPPSCRSADLSFDHHRAVVKLPADERLPMLKQASDRHLKVGELKELVVQKRYESGDMFEDEDVDSSLASIIYRDWNRATPAARELAFALIAIAAKNGFTIIDEDKPTDA